MSTTLEDVVIDLVMNNVDRGALVREAPNEAVIVLILEDHALSELARNGLKQIVDELGDAPVEIDGKVHTGRPDEPLLLQTPVRRIFELCDESPRHWLYFEQRIATIDFKGYVFTGRELCLRVAEVCNRSMCPCSFDRDKPAPGFRITKRIERR